jgi:integrase
MPDQPSPSSSGYTSVAECLYRNNTSGIYYALFKRGGKQIRRSLKTADRKFAEWRLAELRQKISQLYVSKTGAPEVFLDVTRRWFATWRGHLKPTSARRREGVLKNLNAFFGRYHLRNINRALCESWAQVRAKETAPATFNLERDTLETVLQYAKREGLLLDNPAEILERRRPKKVAIEIPTHRQFLFITEWLADWPNTKPSAEFIELLGLSGMRRSEATAFRLCDVDFKRGTFTVTGGEQGTKNHEARIVPLFPSLRVFLERVIEERDPPIKTPLITVSDAKKSLARVCRFYKWPVFTHHSMRHFFVSNALEKGVDFKTVAAWVGHKDGGLLVAKTYGHLRDVHSTRMAKRMHFNFADTRFNFEDT